MPYRIVSTGSERFRDFSNVAEAIAVELHFEATIA
jgi:predicted nucleic acid-binding OB-fold protein